MKKSWMKYVTLFGLSLLTAACSLFFDEIANEERANEIAEKAAKEAVEEYIKRTAKQGNRAQRRGH